MRHSLEHMHTAVECRLLRAAGEFSPPAAHQPDHLCDKLLAMPCIALRGVPTTAYDHSNATCTCLLSPESKSPSPFPSPGKKRWDYGSADLMRLAVRAWLHCGSERLRAALRADHWRPSRAIQRQVDEVAAFLAKHAARGAAGSADHDAGSSLNPRPGPGTAPDQAEWRDSLLPRLVCNQFGSFGAGWREVASMLFVERMQLLNHSCAPNAVFNNFRLNRACARVTAAELPLLVRPGSHGPPGAMRCIRSSKSRGGRGLKCCCDHDMYIDVEISSQLQPARKSASPMSSRGTARICARRSSASSMGWTWMDE